MTRPIATNTADGTTRDFDVPFPYLLRDHVKVYVDNVPVPINTWLNASRLRLTNPPKTGDRVVIRRETPSAPIVTIRNNKPTPAEEYNKLTTQAIYLAGENWGGLTIPSDDLQGIWDRLNELGKSTAKLTNSTRVDLPIVIMWTGQSNATGHSLNGGDRSTKNPNVFIFESVPSNPGQTVGWKNAGPESPDWPLFSTGNHIGWHVADIVQRMTGRTVCLIGAGAGGQPIAEWLPNGGGGLAADGVTPATGLMFGALTANHALALDTVIPNTGLTLRQMGRTRADFVVWHQGEADADYKGTTKAQWKARFKRWYDVGQNPSAFGSSAEPFLWFGTPVLIGELLWGGTASGGATDDRNDAIAELDASYPYFASVSSRNLPTAGDNLHFSGSGLVEFAWRYVRRLFVFPKLDTVKPKFVTDLNALSESGTYRHGPTAVGAPVAVSGYVEYLQYGDDTGLGVQTWQEAGGGRSFRRYSNISNVWGGWQDTRSVEFVSASNIRVAGIMKLFKGTVNVPASSSLTVPLPETMANSTFIPSLTVISAGTSTPYCPIMTAKTATSFTVENKNAAGLVVSWSVFDAVA